MARSARCADAPIACGWPAQATDALVHWSSSEATASAGGSQQAATWLKTSGLGHAVSIGTTLAVHLQPLAAAAGLGTRLIETRIQAGKDQADALRRLGQELRMLQAQSAGEVADLRTEKRA